MLSRKIAVRGLARLAGWIFLVWGGLVFLRGIWDCFLGQPEANFYSPIKWQFVTRDQWLRYAGFEIFYGFVCAGLGWLAWEFSKRLPSWIERQESNGE